MRNKYTISARSLFDGILVVGAAFTSWIIFSTETSFWLFVYASRGLTAVAIFDLIFTPFKSRLENIQPFTALFYFSFLVKMLIVYSLKTALLSAKFVLVFAVVWIVLTSTFWGVIYLINDSKHLYPSIFYGTTLLMICAANWGNKILRFVAPHLRMDSESQFEKFLLKNFLGQDQIRFAVYSFYLLILTVQSAVQLSLISKNWFHEDFFPLALQSFFIFLAFDILVDKKHLIPGPRTVLLLTPELLRIIWSKIVKRKEEEL